MWFALGAASSILDGLQSLGSSKSTSGRSGSGSASSLFDFLGGSNSKAATSASTQTSSGTGAGTQIAPQTMSALIAAQSDANSATTAPNASYTDPLQDLFSQIDGNGDGQISKSEFENTLGAGGTNVAQADDVFSKLDKNGDGNVSLDEMKSALQGAGGHHGHHHHVAASSEASDTSSSTASSSDSDALLQAVSDSQNSDSQNNGDGSTPLAASKWLRNGTGPYQMIQLAQNQPLQSLQNASAHVSSVSLTV
jgi:Ca2+-binding EF-hand superfamily protein